MDKPALIYWAVNCMADHLNEVLRPEQAYTEEQLKVIIDDAKGARFRASSKALNIGKEAHDWIERYIKGKLLKLDAPALPEYPPVLKAVQSYLDWEQNQEIEYASSERLVYSRRYGYAGTCDAVLKMNDELVVADFKTSKDIYPEYWLQVAAYAYAVEEEDQRPVHSVAVIRIPKDGEEVEIQTVGYDWRIDHLKTFMACLQVYKWKTMVA
jgi:hypothetical protein